MNKVLFGAAVASMLFSSVSFAQDRAAYPYPGEAGFVVPLECQCDYVQANGPAGCLALFPGMTATEARALLAALEAEGCGTAVQLLLAALREAGLAAGPVEASPL